MVLGEWTKSMRSRGRIHLIQLRSYFGRSRGNNFVVAAVDNTRREDNVPTLETDWWNYGGLTREISLIEVPEEFIDQYDLHLSRGRQQVIDGWVHVEGGKAGDTVEVEIPEIVRSCHSVDWPNGRATVRFEVKGVQRWSPETPKLYKVTVRAGRDSLTN